ncbi:MAG TPA: B-box zinc finger protein [Desulfatiglandales bacterium]|nr:B-box zinc finger protein [Desulfatiglandales bacterium]
MKCNNHPNREAIHFCASCGIPLCDDCVEEPRPGQFFCFQCAMVQAVSGAGTSLKDKREKHIEQAFEKKKPWGPFQYFVTLSSVLIVVMWAVILFGGGEASPGKKIDYAKQERVFLFMVDSSIKRYAYYEGNKYPEKLSDLVPKYLPMRKEDIPELNRLSYELEPKTGYRLSLANPKPGSMNIIITPKGISYKSDLSESNL